MLFLFTLLYLSLMVLPEGSFVSGTPTAMGNIAKQGCRTHCGNLTVEYPFGIDKGCSIDETFDLTCNFTYNLPKLFVSSKNIEIFKISDSEMTISNSVAYRCYNKSGHVTEELTASTNLHTTPFTFSQKNKFAVIGCDDFAFITGTNGVDFSGGCLGLCSNASDVPNGYCSGIGCCQIGIPKGLKFYNATLVSLRNHTRVLSFNRCGFAFLGEEASFKFGGVRDFFNASEFIQRINSGVPMVVDWVIGGNRSCTQATECKGNSTCNDADIGGYRCSCNQGYEGNPYLDPGCKALVSGLLAILSGIIGIWFCTRKRKLVKLREKFFVRNGGVFMKQKLMALGVSDAMTLFSTEELQKATDNYSDGLIVGRGGYGTVYKGILPDKRVVAIKRSRLMDDTQVEQFVNEVVILTQVIHRNVVKLLGCCLEEEVPLLVYEFISNDTLFYHIHHKPGGMDWLSWENRLRVASEAAAALAYLHSQATMPIIHRDVKSANILLDEHYTAKITDFGGSRLLPLDHNQVVTTLVQGTLGYLDPEYFHTSQLTDKSDVYSFGVLLAELITGQKPISFDRTDEERVLATYFVRSMKENRLFQIVEPQVLREGTLEELQAVAEIARGCLNLRREDRPTMKEVARELEGLRKITTQLSDQQQTTDESRSSILEVEQSDLYGVQLIPYSSKEWESYSGITQMFQDIKRR